jgi:hypothetical protein
MASNTLKRAIGLFSDRDRAEQALIELKSMGFPCNKISAIAKTSEQNVSTNLHNTSQPSLTRAEGAKAGAVAGSAVGGLLTLAAGLSVLLIPGFGPALAVESLIATILGSGAVAAVTGLYGGLRGWLVPDEQAKIYSDRVDRGDYLVAIEATENEIRIAEPVLKRWGISNWHIYDAV